MKQKIVIGQPDRLSSYFKAEWLALSAVTVTGMIYNIGLLAGPWFEGKLAQCLFDIFGKTKTFSDMLKLAAAYVAVTVIVQSARYMKRFYVRRFGNHINRNMKQILYAALIHHSQKELESENVGSIITKAISDVDTCSEGMRKFTTEVFDTGVALAGYVALLFTYDWRLALISLIFPPISYYIAEKLKVVVQRTGAAAQESRSRLNAATLDRVSNASTYRVFGCEAQRNSAYDEHLADYEKSAVKANIWVAAMPPVYHIISMISMLFILWFGSRNVLGTGWTSWDIAAFTTFISCFTKLAVKSSKAAKLFNAVQKAEVSWKRIKPLMKPAPDEAPEETIAPETLKVRNLGVAYGENEPVFSGLSFTAKPGEIIGVTGAVACGKTTLGQAFLCERPYQGSIRFGNEELSTLSDVRRSETIGYLGHDPELLSETIQNNVLLGENTDVWPLLKAVCIDEEVSKMPDGIHTVIGSSGVRLSGGQQARIGLARTLAHKRPVLILDDPFSALDRHTEKEVFRHIQDLAKDSIVILISHRLYLFPQLDQVIWMENGQTTVGTHQELMERSSVYADLYHLQEGGADGEKDEKIGTDPSDPGSNEAK